MLTMFLQNFNLLCWNVRGLGCTEKCGVVRNIIKNSRCDVCLLQETKCNKMDVGVVLKYLLSFFNSEVAYNQAINSAGGILIAWKRSFQLLSSWSSRHCVTVLLRQTSSGWLIQITSVYGPTEDALKHGFISELHSIAASTSAPWILAGDFNLTRWLTDRPKYQGVPPHGAV